MGCKRDENASMTCISGGNISIKFLRYELLPLKNRVLLQHLKVVLLICGMLVDYKEVRVKFGYDEAQIKLTDDLHVFKHFFAVDEDDTIYCNGTFSALLPSFAGGTSGIKTYWISFLSSASALWFSPGLILALNRR